MEGPNSNSNRIEDKVLAEKMAHAGDKYRTIAAKDRAEAEDLESPKTIRSRITRLILGKRGTKTKVENIRDVATSADRVASEREDNVAIRDMAKKEAQDLSDEELESLVDQSFQDYLIAEEEYESHIKDNDNQFFEKKFRLNVYWQALSKILILRQSVKARVEQERKNKNP